MSVIFYVSGHGFGHAARQQAIIKQIAKTGIAVHAKTPTPPKFFDFPNVTYHDKRYDIGLIQPDSLTVDVDATFEWYRDFLKRQPDIVAEEVAFIREQDVRLIVSDMPPIAFEIAEQAGIPSVACTHFTWDWIYAQYMPEYKQYMDVLNSIQASYNKATLALQMPFAHEFDMFQTVEKIPLVVNDITETRDQLRQRFDVPDDHHICLLSMGGLLWGDNDVSALREVTGWTFWVMPDMWEQVKDLPHAHLIPTEYPDYHNLIAAADVVVGKAGGTTIAESIAHRTAMLYTIRTGYSENVLLENALKHYSNCRYVEKSAFQSGEWVAYLDEIVSKDYVWKDIATNGAEVAANRILDLMQSG